MKKMLIVLLSLGMILSGCIQNEHPEEPPVVEDETEKQPTIDEDKNNINQPPVSELDKHKYTYSLIEKELYSIHTINYDFDCNSNSIVNHYCGVDRIQINIESEKFNEINQYEINVSTELVELTEFFSVNEMTELENSKRGHWKGYGSQMVFVNENEEILTICIEFARVPFQSGYTGRQYRTYSIDLINNEVLNTREILNLYNIDSYKILDSFNSDLIDLGYVLAPGENYSENPKKDKPFDDSFFDSIHIRLCVMDDRIGIHCDYINTGGMLWYDLKNFIKN